MTTPDQGMPQEAPPAPGQSGSNVAAILGLIGAIAGLVLFFVPVIGLVIAVVGLILSIVGMKGAGAKGGAGKGVAIAGLVIAILGVLAGGVSTACWGVVAKGAHDAAKSNGFHSFTDMMKAAESMPKQLDAAARKAGYKNYAAWHAKDPKAAQAAANALGKKLGDRMKGDTQQLNHGAGSGTQAAPSGGGSGK